MNVETVMQFLASPTKGKGRGNKRKSPENNAAEEIFKRAASSIGGYISARKNLHKESSIEMSLQMKNALNEFNTGYSRDVAKSKENGEMPIREGKSHLTFGVYSMLAKEALMAPSRLQKFMFLPPNVDSLLEFDGKSELRIVVASE